MSEYASYEESAEEGGAPSTPIKALPVRMRPGDSDDDDFGSPPPGRPHARGLYRSRSVDFWQRDRSRSEGLGDDDPEALSKRIERDQRRLDALHMARAAKGSRRITDFRGRAAPPTLVHSRSYEHS